MGASPILEAPFSQTHLIYVAGNLGSGKSTLVDALSRAEGWELLPEQSPPLDYLPDLFKDPIRWSLETQVAFLASKAETVRKIRNVRPGAFAVVDRSVYEHYEVFVRAFHEVGAIDDRSIAMFARLHNQVIEGLPRPSAIVLCDAPPDVCEARIQARARSLDRLYPDGHLARLGQHLSNWVRSFMEAPVLVFDSVNDDPRDIETATCVRQDVENFIQRGGIPNTCLRLYR